jgi:hypothetical protein
MVQDHFPSKSYNSINTTNMQVDMLELTRVEIHQSLALNIAEKSNLFVDLCMSFSTLEYMWTFLQVWHCVTNYRDKLCQVWAIEIIVFILTFGQRCSWRGRQHSNLALQYFRNLSDILAAGLHVEVSKWWCCAELWSLRYNTYLFYC